MTKKPEQFATGALPGNRSCADVSAVPVENGAVPRNSDLPVMIGLLHSINAFLGLLLCSRGRF